MKLQDVYDQLSYGELRLTFMGAGKEGSSTDKPDFMRLLPSMVLGLTSLHSRFRLREGTMTVALTEGRASYVLMSQFAESENATNPIILDSADPFKDNLLKIEKIYGICDGVEYRIPLNNTTVKHGIRTPTMTSLLLPTDTDEAPWLLETTELRVVYRQDHPALDLAVANAAPTEVTVELPPSHLQALLLFMASRIVTPMGMDPGVMHDGNNFQLKYDTACSELQDLGLEIDEVVATDQPEINGWP